MAATNLEFARGIECLVEAWARDCPAQFIAVTPLLRVERILGGFGRQLAFRMLVVLERKTD